jgi:hypothetical protein
MVLHRVISIIRCISCVREETKVLFRKGKEVVCPQEARNTMQSEGGSEGAGRRVQLLTVSSCRLSVQRPPGKWDGKGTSHAKKRTASWSSVRRSNARRASRCTVVFCPVSTADSSAVLRVRRFICHVQLAHTQVSV